MMNTGKVLAVLRQFKHASRTNLKKLHLTNHDAVAYILCMLGPMSVSEIIDVLNMWRDDKTRHYTYLFNRCTSGGYGFVASHANQTGNWMKLFYLSEGYSSPGYCSPYVTTCRHTQTNPDKYPYPFDPNVKYSFRYTYCFRYTYWYRHSKGYYAPTVACFDRISKLQMSTL